jgi:hypothetical protein
MAEYLIQEETLRDIINALKVALGITSLIKVSDIPQYIEELAAKSSGPSGVIEISTEAEMDAVLIPANVGKAYRYVGTTGDKYFQGDIYLVEEGT